MSSRVRIMNAGHSCSTTYNTRVNGDQGGGSKLQGLPPNIGKESDIIRYINLKSYGENRDLVFCINQIGGIGAVGSGNRSRTFATTADGVKDCKPGKHVFKPWTGVCDCGPCHDVVNNCACLDITLSLSGTFVNNNNILYVIYPCCANISTSFESDCSRIIDPKYNDGGTKRDIEDLFKEKNFSNLGAQMVYLKTPSQTEYSENSYEVILKCVSCNEEIPILFVTCEGVFRFQHNFLLLEIYNLGDCYQIDKENFTINNQI